MKKNDGRSFKGHMAILSLIITALLVGIDQGSKFFVIKYLYPAGRVEVIPNFFYLTYLENRGAAFGSMANMRWLFMPLTVVGCVGLAVFLLYYKKHTVWSRIAVILVLAGGIGNMADRVILGYVVDFFDFPFFGYIFNFADCCVVVGAAFLVVAYIIAERNEKKRNSKKVETETENAETIVEKQ